MTKTLAVMLAAAFSFSPSEHSASASEPQLTLREVRIVGAPTKYTSPLLDQLATRAGLPPSASAVAADIGRLWRTGLFVDVAAEADQGGRRIIFRVTPHPLGDLLAASGNDVRIESIEIRGNRKTRDAVIRREMLSVPGDSLARAPIEASAKRIRATGHFDAVEVAARPGTTPRLAVVTFTVKERATGEFSVGGSYGEISGIGLSGDVSQINLFGTGHSLRLATRIAQRRQRFVLRYRNPRIADSLWRGSATIYNDERQLPGLRRTATGLTASVGRHVSKTNRFELTYRLEDVSTRAADPNEPLLRETGQLADFLTASGLTSSLRAELIHDSRRECDGAVCEGGVASGVYGEIASGFLGSDNRFVRVGGWTTIPVALTKSSGFVFHGRADWIGSPQGNRVPISERLYLGGNRGIRGYRHGELSPRLPTADGLVAIGGTLRLLATAELHVPLIAALGISGVAFADVGNLVDLDRRTCRMTNGCPSSAEILAGLRAAVGAGLRWRSPIGPLRFDWGIPLYRAPGTSVARFHFGLAENR